MKVVRKVSNGFMSPPFFLSPGIVNLYIRSYKNFIYDKSPGSILQPLIRLLT
jgi:hypothetical protein